MPSIPYYIVLRPLLLALAAHQNHLGYFKYLYIRAASQTNHIIIFQSRIQSLGVFKAHQVIPMCSKSWEPFGGFSIYLCEMCSPWRQWISFLKGVPMISISRKTSLFHVTFWLWFITCQYLVMKSSLSDGGQSSSGLCLPLNILSELVELHCA